MKNNILLVVLGLVLGVTLGPAGYAQTAGDGCSVGQVSGPDPNGDNMICDGGVFVVAGSGVANADSIISGTTSITANSTGYISLTTGGTTTGFFDTSGRLIVPGISVTTNNSSFTTLYTSGNMGIGTTPPTVGKLDILQTFTSLSNPTDAVAYIHANTMDNLGASADPVLLRLYGYYGGTPKGRLFSAENGENTFELVNSKTGFARIYSGTYGYPVAGTAYGPKPMLGISFDGALSDGYTPLIGAGVNLNVSSWSGATLSYKNVYGVPVKVRGANHKSYGFYSDVSGGTDNWSFYAANGDAYFADNVGIGTTSPSSTLHVPDGKYAQFEDFNTGAPPSGDCDADNERGRMSLDTTNNRLYLCMGASRGWDYAALTD